MIYMKKTEEYYAGDSTNLVGPGAISALKEINEIKRPDHLLQNYMVFVQDRSTGSRYLPEASSLLIIQQEVTLYMMHPKSAIQYYYDDSMIIMVINIL